MTYAQYIQFIEDQKQIAINEIGNAQINCFQKISDFSGDIRYARYLNADGEYEYEPMPGEYAKAIVADAIGYASMSRVQDISDIDD